SAGSWGNRALGARTAEMNSTAAELSPRQWHFERHESGASSSTLAARRSSSCGSWSTAASSATLSRREIFLQAGRGSRGLWRDLPRYGTNGHLECTGPEMHHPVPAKDVCTPRGSGPGSSARGEACGPHVNAQRSTLVGFLALQLVFGSDVQDGSFCGNACGPHVNAQRFTLVGFLALQLVFGSDVQDGSFCVAMPEMHLLQSLTMKMLTLKGHVLQHLTVQMLTLKGTCSACGPHVNAQRSTLVGFLALQLVFGSDVQDGSFCVAMPESCDACGCMACGPHVNAQRSTLAGFPALQLVFGSDVLDGSFCVAMPEMHVLQSLTMKMLTLKVHVLQSLAMKMLTLKGHVLQHLTVKMLTLKGHVLQHLTVQMLTLKGTCSACGPHVNAQRFTLVGFLALQLVFGSDVQDGSFCVAMPDSCDACVCMALRHDVSLVICTCFNYVYHREDVSLMRGSGLASVAFGGPEEVTSTRPAPARRCITPLTASPIAWAVLEAEALEAGSELAAAERRLGGWMSFGMDDSPRKAQPRGLARALRDLSPPATWRAPACEASKAIREPLVCAALSPAQTAPEKRRDAKCPVRSRAGSPLARRVELHETSLHPLVTRSVCIPGATLSRTSALSATRQMSPHKFSL
ncbi:unnamed protein product, partial [Polarella glacialis]